MAGFLVMKIQALTVWLFCTTVIPGERSQAQC
jgi:hypothetical protein